MNEKLIKTGLREQSKQRPKVQVFSFGKEIGFGTMNMENKNSKYLKIFNKQRLQILSKWFRNKASTWFGGNVIMKYQIFQ